MQGNESESVYQWFTLSMLFSKCTGTVNVLERRFPAMT